MSSNCMIIFLWSSKDRQSYVRDLEVRIVTTSEWSTNWEGVPGKFLGFWKRSLSSQDGGCRGLDMWKVYQAGHLWLVCFTVCYISNNFQNIINSVFRGDIILDCILIFFSIS